jgi:hypothetical protein
MLDTDVAHVDVELFRHQHRERRISALPHLDHRRYDRDLALTVEADEGIGRE